MNADSSNNSLPSTHPVVVSIPSLPTCYSHGENRITKHHKQRCTLIGQAGKLHTSIPVVVYTSNKNIICRTLPVVINEETATGVPAVPVLPSIHPTLSSFVYRGHSSNVTAIGVSKSGAYIASGDEKGTYKVWAYDHPDHLCKYTMNSFFTGPIHDIDWDCESKRIVIAGERSLSDTMTGVNTKVVQWDTGVSIVHTTNTGMAIHLPRGRATACSFKSTRPYRIVTAGMEDGKLAFHSGPPFTKVPVVTNSNATTTPMETAHKTGSTIHAVRYHPAGTYVVSVGSDKAICLYDGSSLELLHKLDMIHEATIYDVAWSTTSDTIVTASGDGTCKLFTVVKPADSQPPITLKETQVWNVAQYQLETDRGGGDGDNRHPQPEAFDMEKLAITTSRSTSSATSTSFPVGGVQLGCTFVQNGTIPVSVGYNGQIMQLLSKSSSTTSSLSTNDTTSVTGTCHLVATGHCAPIAASCYSRMNDNIVKMYTGDTDGVLCQWDVSITATSSTGGNSPVIQPVRRVVPVNNSDLLYVTHHGAISGTAILYPPQSSTKDNAVPMLLSVGWDDHLYISMNEQVKYSQAIGSQPTTVSSGGTSVACIVTVKGLVLVMASTKGDTGTPVSVSTIIPIPYEAQIAVISSDDSMLYVGGKDCKIYIYRIDGNEISLQHTIVDGHYKPIYSLSISNDGTKLASGDDRDLCVWDISSPTTPTVLVGRGKWCFHTQRITTIGWSMDDRLLISGGADDSIYIWCIEKKMTRLHYNYTHRGGVVSIHCMPSIGKYQFISCGNDAVVNLWDVTTDIEKKFGIKF